MSRLGRLVGGILNERQAQGFDLLYRGLPRSHLVLLGLFVAFYAVYWTAHLLGAPGEVLRVLELPLGLMLGITLAITLLKMWPRFEHALPSWFRSEVEAPLLQPYHKVMLWAGMAVLVLAATLGMASVVFAVVTVMGLIGGVFILYVAEGYVLSALDRTRSIFPWLWKRGGWTALLVLILAGAALVAATVLVAVAVGPTEEPGTHVVKALPVVMILVPSIALFVLLLSLTTFMLIMVWRWGMGRRERKGKRYGARRSALRRVHPMSLAFYLVGVNIAAGGFLFMYTLLTAAEAVAEARSQGLSPGLDLSGFMVPGEMIDYLALASFAMAWIVLLLNLSGSAARSERWYLNRRSFAAVTVLVLMVLLLHIIVVRGDEFLVNIVFRAMYMVGLLLAPIVIYWRRWKLVGSHAPSAGPAPSDPVGPSQPF